MSAAVQVRVRAGEAPPPEPETVVAASDPGRENPLQLLRDAIACLNSPNGRLPDHMQMAGLLAEVREALERANVIAHAIAQSEEFVAEARFDMALQVLDAGLASYPRDAALVARRSDVEERQRASQSAATVRTALEEAQWLLNQDRLDLAATFLKEKAARFPDQPELTSRLAEIEASLPQWEQNRHVQAALGRVAALEDLQQWQVALTIIEEALQSHSASAELTNEARGIRDRLADQERQTRLTRRLELIGRKISSQSWKQAEALLESTQDEFPGAPELEPLQRKVQAGLKRAECESVVTEVRQCLADGELEQAEQFLRRGVASLGREPALEALERELESEKNYRSQLRTAQILFGRRQLAEAESVLSGLADASRSETRALLDAVRNARAETEEANFCERGREQVLKMMQQRQFAQAIDLLRNLLSLFPGNPILERDLVAAQNALTLEKPEIGAAAAATAANEGEEGTGPGVPDTPAPPLSAMQPSAATRIANSETSPVPPPSRVRRVAISGAASLALITAGGAAWKLSLNNVPVSRPPATAGVIRSSMQIPAPVPPPPAASVALGASATLPAATSQKAPALPAPKPSLPPQPQPAAPVDTAPGKASTPPETVPQRVLKPFVPVATKQKAIQAPVVPSPPETVVVPANIVAALPAGLAGPINAPAPLPAPVPSAAPVQSAAPAALPAPKQAANGFQEAQLIERVLPVYPAGAVRLRISGQVRLEATVDERGAVKNVKTLGGNPMLATAAVQAVKMWKYKAATNGGKPVPTTISIQVEFKGDNAGK